MFQEEATWIKALVKVLAQELEFHPSVALPLLKLCTALLTDIQKVQSIMQHSEPPEDLELRLAFAMEQKDFASASWCAKQLQAFEEAEKLKAAIPDKLEKLTECKLQMFDVGQILELKDQVPIEVLAACYDLARNVNIVSVTRSESLTGQTEVAVAFCYPNGQLQHGTWLE